MPTVQFIMLTVYQDSDRLISSLMAGAGGYLLKRTPPNKLLRAIREVCAGGAPMTPEMARRVVQHFQQAPAPTASLPPLTPREKDVLGHLAKGYAYKEIASHLNIGIGTLQGYISTSMRNCASTRAPKRSSSTWAASKSSPYEYGVYARLKR